MIIDIVIPTDQREGTQSSIGRWLKNVGDSVKQNEPIVEIHTDKVTLEVASPATGRLSEILAPVGKEIVLSDTLGRIDVGATTEVGSGATGKEAAPIAAAVADRTVGSASLPAGHLSPAVRALAKKLSIDLGTIKGTGAGGRITAQDVERAASAGQMGAVSGKAAQVVAPKSSAAKAAVGTKRRPHSPMRKSIAAHMVESVTKAPHVTSVFDCDFSAVLADKKARDKEFSAAGVKLTVTAYLVHAAAQALRAVPEVNSRWHDDALELLDEVHIGVAAAVEESQGGGAGLVVPVVRDADRLSLLEIARVLQDLSARARSNQLKSAELSGATFSISNHGVGGSLFAAPIIIPQPQSAILGVGKVEKRIVVTEEHGVERFGVTPMGYVTLTIDHRALDGFTANAFLRAFTANLQQPR
jgi:2-oxoglutarate dehydrogenase E2 component (dihydrolipoamide succinyltransferase)